MVQEHKARIKGLKKLEYDLGLPGFFARFT
jgi:hypothetical protein